MDELLKLADESEITIIVEKSPAGGLIGEEILCELEKGGIDVYLYDGAARYMHAKYIIKDSKEVLVSTENFGSSGGRGGSEQAGTRWGSVCACPNPFSRTVETTIPGG